jgi:hypothetical protein
MKLLMYSVLILFTASGCTYLTYGIDSIPSGCEIQSYRTQDGSLKYYFVGNNCNETEREFHEKHTKANGQFL